ncbi:hypothetical protein Tco_1067462 [Tanacetum coccineum]|uniref:Uncharacterized protein n=1 Tax=Tanacetum coccineum TaxID=301880 RepID=A0ABQ5HCY2_9ASTR
MIPQAVLMRSGLKTINTARLRATVNAAKPKAVHNAVKRNRFHDVKASACWVWKPKNRVIDHGRKITEIDQDLGISLVQHDAEIQGRHEHEPEFDFDAANVPVTTAGAEIRTASPEVKTASNAKMEKSESAITKTKRQQEQERLGFEVAVRLQAELDKEERQRISRAKGLQSVEDRLVHYKKNKAVFEESINVLKLEDRLRDNALDEYKNELEKKSMKKKRSVKTKIRDCFRYSSILHDLLESQVIDKFKTRLGYNAATLAVESFVNLSNKSGSDKGYHSDPPPLTGNFIPRKPDLTFMDEIVESENLDVTTVVTPSNVKTVENKDVSSTVESNAVRMNNISTPIIED